MNRSALLLAFILSFSLCATAQKFPEDFTGRWQGTLQWFKESSKIPQTVPMQLNVLPADTAGQFTWQLVYGNNAEDNRPYLLKPVDTAKGHWVIDERDGLVLDCFWIGGRLCSSFSVGGSTIVNTHYRSGDSLVIEFLSYPTKPFSTTKSSNAAGTVVDSYQVRSFQRAVLRRR